MNDRSGERHSSIKASCAFLWKQERVSQFAQHTLHENREEEKHVDVKGLTFYLLFFTIVDRFYHVLFNKTDSFFYLILNGFLPLKDILLIIRLQFI